MFCLLCDTNCCLCFRKMPFLFFAGNSGNNDNLSLVRDQNIDENNEKLRWQETVSSHMNQYTHLFTLKITGQ